MGGAGAHKYPGKAVGSTEANAVGATEVDLIEGTEVHINSENEEQDRGKAGVPCNEVEGEEEESRSAINTGGYCPASAVYHLIDGTLSGLQECVISEVRAATRAGRAPSGGVCCDVEMGRRRSAALPCAEIDRLIDHGRI